MKLAIFNGSPRQKKSNSKLLIDKFLEGFSSISNENYTVDYLGKIKNNAEHLSNFQQADVVIVIFPLYTDSMPGIVKQFFELIYHNASNYQKSIGFIIQSGFPETIHSSFVVKYLEKLTKRLKCNYLGSVIKGGVEGIQIQPPFITAKLFANFYQLGYYFAQNKVFCQDIVKKMNKPYKMNAFRRGVFKLMKKTGLANFYWNHNLKKNNAYEIRFDKPFL